MRTVLLLCVAAAGGALAQEQSEKLQLDYDGKPRHFSLLTGDGMLLRVPWVGLLRALWDGS